MKRFSFAVAALAIITASAPTVASAQDKPMADQGAMHNHHKMMHHHRMHMLHHHKKMMKKEGM